MTKKNLKKYYQERYTSCLCKIAEDIKKDLKDNLSRCRRIDHIGARPKEPASFIKKSNKIEEGKLKYSDPLKQIQDQIGARVVILYSCDLEKISRTIEKYYRPIEKKVYVPDSEKEFGYEGKHYILFIPDHIYCSYAKESCPKFFELQIKTIFQHAWAEAEHDLGYKTTSSIEFEEKRKLAFTAAQAWGADRVFSELFLLSKKIKNKKI